MPKERAFDMQRWKLISDNVATEGHIHENPLGACARVRGRACVGV